jgi:hypothetical protein
MTISLQMHTSPKWVAQIVGSIDSILAELDIPQTKSFWSITQTDDELSIVSDIERHDSFRTVEGPWALFQVEGVLEFGLTGILNSLTEPMADAGISIFAISTYNTDYILVKSDVANQAKAVWMGSGFTVKTA